MDSIVKRVINFILVTLHGNKLVMKAINFNMTTGKIKFDILSNILRVPYLLMDSIVASGDTGVNIYTVEILKRASLKDKIEILENSYERLDCDDLLAIVRKMKAAYKQQNAMKHPERKVIIAYNKMMQSLEPFYDSYINGVLVSLKKTGLVDLKGIIDDDIFWLMEVVEEKVTNFKKNACYQSPTSLLQSLLASPAEEPRILSIANDLVNSLFVNEKKVFRYSDPEATDENEVYLYKCLTIPSPSMLKASELIAVRNSLRASTIDFNNALRDWSYCFIHNDSAEIKINRFANEIITQLATIQTAIDNNSILQYQKTTNTEKDINVWIGEAPLPVIWDYYKYYGIIDDDVYGMLQSALVANAELKHRIPIMVIDTGGLIKTDTVLPEQKALKDESLELIARKYISIT